VRAPPAGGSAAHQPPELKLEAPLDLDAIFGPETDDMDASGAAGSAQCPGMTRDEGFLPRSQQVTASLNPAPGPLRFFCRFGAAGAV
jgi:hypothetical protein